MNDYKKNIKMLKYIIIGFVILFIISLSSFYFILLPKINNADNKNENNDTSDSTYDVMIENT